MHFTFDINGGEKKRKILITVTIIVEMYIKSNKYKTQNEKKYII
jgi:hypothetical protein